MAEVGKHIRKIRKEKNLTQDELAARLHCTRQTISNYETGRSEPDIALLVELAGVLGVEAGDLIYGPKKNEGDRRQKGMAVAALVTACVLLAVIRIFLPYAQEFAYHYFALEPVLLLQYVLQPFALVLLGWGMAEAGKAFADICIWKNRKQRTIRIIRACYYITVVILAISAVLALCTAVELTYSWWKLVQTRKAQGDFEYSATWVFVCYMRAVMLDRLGGAGLFLGAALGLCKVKRQEPDRGNNREGQE